MTENSILPSIALDKVKGMERRESVAVIGCGLVGCLAALTLTSRGYRVTMFDYRLDHRDASTVDRNLRSINLAISDRGIRALRELVPTLCEDIISDIIPMYGRMIHNGRGSQQAQAYGLFGESINSIDRAELNTRLLDAVEKFQDVELLFGHKLHRVDFNRPKPLASFAVEGGETVEKEFDFIVGCDGAYSTTRSQMQRSVRMNCSQEYIDCCYLELYIPPAEIYNEEFKGYFRIAPNYLHIWPRHKFMLIALPNADGSFTSTFFGPWDLVEGLDTRAKIESFLLENFADAMDLIGLKNAVRVFEANIRGSLMCVECRPYHLPDGKCIILGDAAHSMVPFYGQGMNCGFEDVRVLMSLLDKHNNDRTAAFEEYTSVRHEDLLAIVKLAKDNYHDMSYNVTSKKHLFKRKLNFLLGKILKDRWLPLYTMISFRADIPYHKAIQIDRKQNKILNTVQYLVLGLCAIGGLKVFTLLRRCLKAYQQS